MGAYQAQRPERPERAGRARKAETGRGPVVVAIGARGGVAALSAARAIAPVVESEMLVVSVVEPQPIYTFETNRALLLPLLVEQQLTERRALVHERVHRLGMRGAHREPAIEIVYGEPAYEIDRIARRHGARMIVMGIGPHGARQRLLSSGTVAATARRAPCPVLAVGEHVRLPARAAVIATDFSPESVHAARTARALIDDGAVVEVVHAWHRPEVPLPNVELATLNDGYVSALPEQFERVRSALAPAESLTVHPVALDARPADIVLAVARAKRADLIVAATHGHGPLRQWLLGSTSSALLRGADCSILLVPDPPLDGRARGDGESARTSTLTAPADWNDELRAFVERNAWRPTRLEIDDPSLGAQVQETGYALVGATYDEHDGRLALMFGGRHPGEAHLTRSFGQVRSIAVRHGPSDRDEALWIRNGESSALLTPLPDHSNRSASSAMRT